MEIYINVENKVNQIIQDLTVNQKEVFLRYNYYTHKYRGNRLNDINVGLFLNDDYMPTAQVYVSNKYNTVKKHLIFNKEGNKVIEIKNIYG